ncbi:MAG: hypothetical protein WBM32_22410 [Crocosphaera sp.]
MTQTTTKMASFYQRLSEFWFSEQFNHAMVLPNGEMMKISLHQKRK